MAGRIANRTDRRGEVIMVLEKRGRHILMHSKSHYPGGIFRLPTGGIRFGEKANSTFCRELWEETGFEAGQGRSIAILLYEFEYSGNRTPFVSYIFYKPDITEDPEVMDPEENISDFLWSPVAEIRNTARRLMSLTDWWADWGRMRSVSHDLVADWLEANPRPV
jgi:8-oxo-dGTP pyrophosphatase MutT (NUDIX family)